MEYPIPERALEAWQKHRGKSPQNPGLIFDRFGPIGKEQIDPQERTALEAVRRAAEKVDIYAAGRLERSLGSDRPQRECRSFFTQN